MFYNFSFINNAFINSLIAQEYQYVSSGTALSDKRRFQVGICEEAYNGIKVMQLHLSKHIEHKFFGPIYPTHEFDLKEIYQMQLL